jgi:hypothetical protein
MNSALPLFLLVPLLAHANPPQGHWRLLDDDSVIEIAPCPGSERLCGHLRGLPRPEPGEKPPSCGEQLLFDLQRQGQEPLWKGQALDPDSGKRYTVRFKPGADGQWQLVVSALGGLVNETLLLAPVPAGQFKPCR